MHVGVDWTGLLGKASKGAKRAGNRHTFGRSDHDEHRTLKLRGNVGRVFWTVASVLIWIYVNPILAGIVFACTMRRIHLVEAEDRESQPQPFEWTLKVDPETGEILD